MDVILMGDINVSLQESHNDCKGELAAVLAYHGLVEMTSRFTPRGWYRGGVFCMWWMQQEGRQVMGRSDYVLIMYSHNFSNVGVREAQLYTHNRKFLVVLCR